MQKKRNSVCIISFSPVARDARVLRQIDYLSPHYDVTVIGQGGRAHPKWQEMGNVTWVPVAPITDVVGWRRRLTRAAGGGLLVAGKAIPASYHRWFWRQPIMRDTYAKAVASRADIFHANDWNALPVAAEAAKQLGGRVVFDDHEYAVEEFDNHGNWSLVYAPMIRYMVGKYVPRADVVVTVAPAIAEKYEREFNVKPMVVMNAPARVERLPERRIDFDNIRLMHHGGAIPDRQLERMIRAVAQSDPRFSLHFMLVGFTPDYENQLKGLAAEIAPGRVTFHEPVPPEQVVGRVSEFDMGFYSLPPKNFVYSVALPNKFFDFIAAGMPVCIGPSPSMAEIVERYGLGCVASSFEPEDLAVALNSLTPERLERMLEGARRAAGEINAEREMGRLVEAYERLLSDGRK
jgi:glycosyltransferase involved in cell wall biosynthesis